MDPRNHSGNEHSPRWSHKPGLVPTLTSFALMACVVFVGATLLVGATITSILDLARDTRDHILPTVAESHRTAINLERMGRFGEIILNSSDPEKRRETRLAAQILAQDSAFEAQPGVHNHIRQIFEDIRNVAELRNKQDQAYAAIGEGLERFDTLIAMTDADLRRQLRTKNPVLERTVGILQAVHAMHERLSDLRFTRTMHDIDMLENAYGDFETAVTTAAGELPRTSTTAATHAVVEQLPEFHGLFHHQRAILQAESASRNIWFHGRTRIEELAQGLTTDAAVTASERFTLISDNASRAKTVAFLNILGVIVVLAVFVLMLRRSVISPILVATRGLEDIRERKPLFLPEARLRELDAILDSVERLGEAHAEIAERTRQLERANTSLELEVAERRHTEERLAGAIEEARSAVRTKSEFLATMSHEIRTPMNAILGMADLLQETRLTPEQSKYVALFQSSGELLLNLINDILDISRVEAGRLKLDNRPFDLESIVDEVCDIADARARAKSLELVCELDPDVKPDRVGDPNRIKQILVNLLGNAVKFTHAGHVRLTVSRAEDEHDMDEALLFRVQDTGIGIAPEKLERVFEAFTQVDSSPTRDYEGTGLGLTIARRLAENMNGRIWLESEPGRGSVFSVLLPLPLSGIPTEEPEIPGELREARVLVAESAPLVRGFLTSILAPHVAQADQMETPALAPEVVEHAAASGAPYRLLVLGTGEPAELRSIMERLARTVPAPQVVLLLSDRNHAEETREGRIPAADAVLRRPVKRREALEAVIQALVPRSTIPVPEHDATFWKERAGGPRILLVEDSDNNRMLVTFFLKDGDFLVETARNGAEAVDKFRHGDFDLVLMDMQMPVMDGYEATARIRDLERASGTSPVPVVALTANAFHDDETRCLEAGCSHYLPKPVKKSELLATISRLLPGDDARPGVLAS